MKKRVEILELKVNVTLSEEALHRLKFGGLGAGPYVMNEKVWSPNKVYETVGLSKKYYEDGSNVSIYFIFDDAGVLRETAIEYWQVLTKLKSAI